MSPKSAAELKPLLDRFFDAAPYAERLRFDPVELPHRYRDPQDVEVVALLSACLAYGRADLFKPKVEALLSGMGPAPARFVTSLELRGARELLEGFVYRFNVGTDLAVLLLGMGRALERDGSLEALFLRGFRPEAGMHPALDAFTRALRDVPMPPLRRTLGRERGLHHLLPSPLGAGAAKRLNLFLRWMVRGPDAVDFGLWRRVPPSALLIPLDTHVGRISRYLGLTRRKDLSWKTAEEITGSLRRLDAVDPVKYDFALCHYGMSGACPIRQRPEHCAACVLLPRCPVGRRTLARVSRRGRT